MPGIWGSKSSRLLKQLPADYWNYVVLCLNQLQPIILLGTAHEAMAIFHDHSWYYQVLRNFVRRLRTGWTRKVLAGTDHLRSIIMINSGGSRRAVGRGLLEAPRGVGIR